MLRNRNRNPPKTRRVVPRQPVRAVPPPKPKVGLKSLLRSLTRRAPDFQTSVMKLLTASFNRPLFLFTTLGAVVFVLTFKSIDEGPIAKLLPADSKNPFVIWARANVAKFIGGLLFIPVIIDSKRSETLVLSLFVVGWVYLVPEGTYYEYAVQAVLLHLYLHLNNATHKVIVFAIGVALYFAGFLFPSVLPPVPPTTRAYTTAAPR